MTDTIESPVEPLCDRIEVISVAPLFAQAIRSIHDRTSVSMLFPDEKQV
jgi:ribose-phosphate pyrophosphokinase